MQKNSAISKNDEPVMDDILSLLRERRGIDIPYLDPSSLKSRIANRVATTQVRSMTEYLSFLEHDKQELEHLYQELIPETRFFRDPRIFEGISEKVLPWIIANKTQEVPLRIWVAGCSSGQEAYSIMICIHEILGKRFDNIKIQVFATDISEKAIAQARSGLYQKQELQGVSEKRLRQYFTSTKEGYLINKIIRSSCIFAVHNYLKDPPFSNIDLISCRNSLVYIDAALQKRALTTFHYGLNKEGYLFLGKAETAGYATDLFAIFDKQSRLYTKNLIKIKFFNPIINHIEDSKKIGLNDVRTDDLPSDFQKNADEELLERFAPPGVIINSEMEIVQFRGSTSKWLESYPGKPSLNILKMAKYGLSFALRSAILQVQATENNYIKRGVRLQREEINEFVTIQIIPLKKSADRHYLVLFMEDEIFSYNGKRVLENDSSLDDSYFEVHGDKHIIDRLQKELAESEENMRISTDEHIAANEELQSANEELLSGSEELQSINEELEASRQEVHSTNEELIVLNQELYDRNDHLNILRLYAESIVATIREPLIILSKDFKVQNANPAFYLKFRETEDSVIGRNVFELGNRQLDIPNLKTLLEKILPARTIITDFEVSHDFPYIGQRTMLLNATPVLRDDSDDQYILLVFEDVTEKRKVADQLRVFAQELESKVVERTESLRKANADLSYSNESLQQFAHIASHDLQEPLRKIKTFSNLLSSEYVNKLPEEAKSLIFKIVGSTDRMSALIREVLEFSRVPHSDITYQKVDLNSIIQENVKDFDLLIKEKKANVAWSSLPFIEGIPLQLSQLFSNLISNSLKFSHTEIPPVINIKSEMLTLEEVAFHGNLNQSYAYCKITVQDNGIGFDPKFSDQVFLIFHRLHGHSRYPGTGIGLALCKKIVINHRGEIDVTSKEGEGTSFHIILPMRQS